MSDWEKLGANCYSKTIKMSLVVAQGGHGLLKGQMIGYSKKLILKRKNSHHWAVYIESRATNFAFTKLGALIEKWHISKHGNSTRFEAKQGLYLSGAGKLIPIKARDMFLQSNETTIWTWLVSMQNVCKKLQTQKHVTFA